MKICCCINSLCSGGKERVMSELINGFISNHDAEVHVVLYGLNPEVFYEINPQAIFHKPTFKPIRNRLLLIIKTMSYLRKEIKRINPDTVLSFGELWNSFVLLALLGTHYPVFVSDRCRPNKSFGKFHDTLRKWLYPKAAGVIAQTEKAKEFYQKQFKQKNIPVIGNPINQIEIAQDNNRENVVVSVGRLIDTKNFDQLISIFTAIEITDWKLIIVGGDALKQTNSITLQEQIDKLGMNDRIELAGTRKNVVDYLKKAKIFAFTSSSEGFPNVVGEALSAGLPVVAYDCIAGPSDMIEDGKNGFLVPLFDKDKFQEKLTLLMEDEVLREKMSAYAPETIKKYALNKVVADYYDVVTSKI
jgi:GalNAc-alpha-(1->4)-GalNAc-alpha-(1->3)-diNAcBac-PP-undecaprenol alpha-1,4-N-acetyl-D-galactosaminyltransferase